MTLVLVDGGHLLAAAGRAAGLGPGRVAGRFHAPRLVSAVLDLLPAEVRTRTTLRWYDAPRPQGGAVPEHEALRADGRVELVLLPDQRHLEAVLLSDLLTGSPGPAPREPILLVGDPRRHAVTLGRLADRGVPVQLVGVAHGEGTPALRWWLRRQEVWRCLAPESRRAVPGRVTPDYRAPDVRASPVRLPGPPTPGPPRP